MTPERLGLLWGITVFSEQRLDCFPLYPASLGSCSCCCRACSLVVPGLGLIEPLDLGPGLEPLLVCWSALFCSMVD